ncbi:MAG TPA: YigZ family protein [Bacteroidales bacterium]|nr:YigZ family protein [Bacteroidales bacterium]
MDAYRTIDQPAEGTFRDRNSRFLAFGNPVTSVNEALEILEVLRKKYHDARHHCYAYRIGVESEQTRMNDDGEPSGTAGKPIYNQILSHGVTNVLVVVVRYFGGTLLGTGGLINAYKSATADMFEHAAITERFIEQTIELKFPYEKLNSIMRILKDENLVPEHPVYEMDCSMQLHVRKGSYDKVIQKLSALGDIHIK